MSEDKNWQVPGSANPLQSAVQPADYTNAAAGDNTIHGLNCDPSVFVGAVVRISGGTVVNALADTITNSNALGICTSKGSSTSCDVQVCGYTASAPSGLTINQNYFLSDSNPGTITTTPPASGSGSIILFIGRARTSSSLIIQIGSAIQRA